MPRAVAQVGAPIKPGEQIFDGNGTPFHVFDVIACEDENEPFVVLSPFVGLLQVEAAKEFSATREHLVPRPPPGTKRLPRTGPG